MPGSPKRRKPSTAKKLAPADAAAELARKRAEAGWVSYDEKVAKRAANKTAKAAREAEPVGEPPKKKPRVLKASRSVRTVSGGLPSLGKNR